MSNVTVIPGFPPGPLPPPVITGGHYIVATKSCFMVVLTMLFYDHLLTLKYEIKYFWKRRLSPVSFLFFFNRYYVELAFIFIAFLFMSPKAVDPVTCSRAAVFLPLGGSVPIGLVASLLLVARVYAIYNQNKVLLFTLLFYLTAQVSVGIYIYAFPGQAPLALPPIPAEPYQICIDATSPRLKKNVDLIWIIMQCGFDLSIFLLILWRSLHVVAATAVSSRNLLQTVVRDGTLYFFAIFTINFTWILMVATAPDGLKYILGVPSLAVFATMASRISLNLRSDAASNAGINTTTTLTAINFASLPKFKSTQATSSSGATASTAVNTYPMRRNEMFELTTMDTQQQKSYIGA